MTPASAGPTPVMIWLAYAAAFLGVCGHASSEFVVKLTGLGGPEVSVWRFMIGGAALLLVALITPSARICSLRRGPVGAPSVKVTSSRQRTNRRSTVSLTA